MDAAVPRNEKKFGNFVKNSLNVRSDPVVKEIWDFMCLKQAAATAAQDAEHAAAAAAPVAAPIEPGDAAKTKKRASEAEASEEQEGDDEAKTSKGAKAKKSKSETATSGDKGGVLSALAEEPNAFDWGKAISKALKAAPEKTLPLKALRKAATAARAALECTDGDDAPGGWSKADLKAAFKAALKAHPKATQAGKGDAAVVAYQ